MSARIAQIDRMDTRLADRFGLRIPLIQAPMAGVSTPELAAAVTNAGGLGSVALGALSADVADRELARTRELTDGPILANVFVHAAPVRSVAKEAAFISALVPFFERVGVEPPERLTEPYQSFNENDDLLEVLVRARPEAVSFHFGPGSPDRIDALKAAGMTILATATTLAEADLLSRSGIDMLVLQHTDAGGHSGAFLDLGNRERPASATPDLDRLVASCAEELALPVIAAGGLMDGRDIGRVIAAGAAGAQLGTAFIACPETSASEAYRARLVSNPATRSTHRISGRLARGIESALIQALEGIDVAVPDYPVAYDAVKRLVAAVGDPEFAVMWAGAGSSRARALPAAELIMRLIEELAQY